MTTRIECSICGNTTEVDRNSEAYQHHPVKGEFSQAVARHEEEYQHSPKGDLVVEGDRIPNGTESTLEYFRRERNRELVDKIMGRTR